MEETTDQLKNQLLEVFNEWEDDSTRAARARGRAMEQIKTILEAVADPHKVDPHLAAYEKFGQSNVPVILFMDIVGYSKLIFDTEQKEAIGLLNRVVRDALQVADCKWDDVVCLPTGDGMCLCFISGTDNPLKVATEVQVILAKENQNRKRGDKKAKKKINVRMGIHLGNVLRIEDLKGSFNLAGAAINLTQRAMDCGGKGHILCTPDAYKQLAQIEGYKKRFKPFPTFTVKHGVRLKLYNYCDSQDGIGNPQDPRNEV